MAQGRVSAPAGTIAWVRGKEYKPGQFLPAGVSVYAVEYFYTPNADEIAAGATGRKVISTLVGVDDTTAEIQAQLDELRDAALEMKIWRDSPQLRTVLGEGEEDEDGEAGF